MKVSRLLDRSALVATLILPLFLLYGRSLAEAMIAITDLCFLIQSAREHRWAWLRTAWFKIGLLWWAWLVLCSLPFVPFARAGLHEFAEALATLRFLIFVAALEWRVLSGVAARRWLARSLALVFLWIGIESLQQYATGHNIFGHPRNGDGELTGPFNKPRAGPPFSRLFFPVVLAPVDWLLAKKAALARIAGVGVMLVAIAVQVLIGQRMPVLLMGLGFVVSFLLLRRLRLLMVAAAVLALALTAASIVISPPTYYRLVEKFSRQMEHFRQSPYGELYVRAVVITREHPLLGLGFDGFRHDCPMPRYFHDLTWVLTGHNRTGFVSRGASVCNEHPHNHYLQAAVESGLPGLVLYAALGAAWLIALGRGLGRPPDPRRVGLFIAALIVIWPIASTSSYVDMPMMGWFFLLLGWGLAETRAAGEAGGWLKG
ncbi:MAG: O-antigen ligase family protein, partial [Acetobacteraceae bacterium]